MTRTPMVVFAIHFDRASEMNEPAKPKNAANTSRPPRLVPCTANQASSPRRRATTDSTRTIARLVARNNTMRFMAAMEPWRSKWLRLNGIRRTALYRYGLTPASVGPWPAFSSPQGAEPSADHDAEGAPDEEAQPARAAADQHHAQRTAQRVAAGKQRQTQADTEQCRERDPGHGRDGAHAGETCEEGDERQRGARRERDERGAGRAPRGAEVLGVEAELLAREHIEGLLRARQQRLTQLARPGEVHAARLVDERELFRLLLRVFGELLAFERNLVF